MQSLAEELLQPSLAYNDTLKNRHEVYIGDLFNSLVQESGINVEENHQTVAEFNLEKEKIANLDKHIAKLRSIRVFVIIVAIVGLLIAVFGIYSKHYPSSIARSIHINNYLISVAGGLIAIGMVLIWIRVLNPKIKNSDSLRDEHSKRADELFTRACEQMAPLNALFDSDMPRQLILKTIPLVKVDRNLGVDRLMDMRERYGYFDRENDPEYSTVGIISGEIGGSPFIIQRDKNRFMGEETYYGELEIHWKEYVTDSEGNEIKVDRYETLTAQVTKPKPYYQYETLMTYCSEVAPNLNFTHDMTHAEIMTEKQLAKHVKSTVKKINKMAVKSMSKGDGKFTPLGNDEFDALFNAYDRDNEVEFRVLFTPLSQQNMLSLMKKAAPFGDNFNFCKKGMLNFIAAEHSANWDINTAPDRYWSHDIDDAHNKFMAFNTAYFRDFFFEIAPILAIEAYQSQLNANPNPGTMTKTAEGNCTAMEAEVLANAIGASVFKHNSTSTDVILNSRRISSEGKADVFEITAHSYEAVERCTYVSVFGGDGYYHDVPVYWNEYIPIWQKKQIEMRELNITDADFSRMTFSHEDLIRYSDSVNGHHAYLNGIFAGLFNPNERMDDIFK